MPAVVPAVAAVKLESTVGPVADAMVEQIVVVVAAIEAAESAAIAVNVAVAAKLRS